MRTLSTRRGFWRYGIPRGGDGVEVGVRDGENARRIIRQNQPRALYLLDVWQNMAQYEAILKEFEDNPTVIVLRGLSVQSAANFANRSLDWAYIDADHRYEAVDADIMAWWPKVVDGGYLCGHDHDPSHPGVQRAVSELLKREGRGHVDIFSDEQHRDWAVQRRDRP